MNEETLSNSNLDSDEIEEIEKLTLRWVFQAVLDFGMEAYEVFLKSPDNVKDISEYGDNHYLTTTCLMHFLYEDEADIHHLKEVKITAIPNGRLQDRYNPTVDDGIWLAGRNAPTRGEDFRVRVSFAKLKEKASWRVQVINYDEITGECKGKWQS